MPEDSVAKKDRIILHLDMNAFFASVEQQAKPALRGKPIAVIGSNGRTVITTASYEARKFGVKTGMAIWEAKRQCPQIILVVGDNRKYTYTSTRIFHMMLDYTPLVEVFSIDEAFLPIGAYRPDMREADDDALTRAPVPADLHHLAHRYLLVWPSYWDTERQRALSSETATCGSLATVPSACK